MKSALPSPDTKSPTFGSQELENTRYVEVICMNFTYVMCLTFGCSAKVDKQDGTHPEYACHFEVLVMSSFFLSRCNKIKTEKAMYAEKVGVDGMHDLK